mmetsp:Transcript_10872/g.23176  ORF Transcript_10872/g.23176 Transcript_10872/m.23176 type:complete len:134 (-) Transcript_10872:196-597(-)
MRKKLELKEQLEAAIEGKHSKLTEVYRALEAQCQNDLRACKEQAATGSEAGEAGAAEGDGTAGCGPTTQEHVLKMLGFLLLGYLAGLLLPSPRALLRRRPGVNGGHVHRVSPDDMRGWMPQTVAVTLENMKIS